MDGWNALVGANKETILKAIRNFEPKGVHKERFGSGNASKKIVFGIYGASKK
jgi:UDP-N-acetylglucosamine 2-epimerase (non-hydrolysing)